MHINLEISVKDITILLQIIRVVVTALSYPHPKRYISIPCPMLQKSSLKENARQPDPDLPGYVIILMKILAMRRIPSKY